MDRISFIPNESEEDLRGHGTSVAECVAAVASEVEIASLKVLDANGRGSLFSILKGLKYVADHRDEIDCANLSLGAKLCGGRNADPLCRSLTELAKLGVPTVTAIGNSGECGRGSVECPGASPGTLGVAAVDLNGRAMSWSSKGPCLDDSIHKPDVACFGSNLVLPDHRGNLHAVSGTSFAVPLVAGTLAACLEMTKKRPGVEQLYDLVRKSCVPAESHSNKPDLVGNGIANLRRAAEIVGATHSEQRTARIRATSLQAGRRCLARFAVTAACLAAVASTWWFGLDHIGFMGATSAPGEVWLLGRVRASASGAMLFDDGTGAVAVQWNGQSDARPRAESIVLLKGQIASAHDKQVAMSGTYRFVLLPSLH